MVKELAVALFAAASMQLAHADVGYASPAWASVATDPTGTNAWCSSCNGTWQAADVFTLGSSAKIAGVDIAVQSGYGSNWNPTVSIWNSTHTTQLFSQTVPWGSYSVNPAGAGAVSVLGLALNGPTLAAGSYYMSWFDGAAMGVPTWSSSNPTLIQTEMPGDFSQANLRDGGAAFQVLTAPVPEPETYAMMMAGLGLLSFIGRRKQRAAA